MDGMTIVKLTQEDIESRIKSMVAEKVGEKTTIVTATLVNGFEIVVSSACVDPAQYDQTLGFANCKKRLIDKIWELEGYLLQQRSHEWSPYNPQVVTPGLLETKYSEVLRSLVEFAIPRLSPDKFDELNSMVERWIHDLPEDQK